MLGPAQGIEVVKVFFQKLGLLLVDFFVIVDAHVVFSF